MDRQGYFKLEKPQVVDADVYVHWSVLAASGLILAAYWQSPIQLVLACLCYFGIIFIHEVGHAAIAKQAGCRVFAIRVHLIHGVCEHESPRYELDNIKIAWAGVVMQILVAILVFALSSLGLSNYRFFSPALVFLGYLNLLIVPYNLMPLRGLDGFIAWRIIPLLYRRFKERRR